MSAAAAAVPRLHRAPHASGFTKFYHRYLEVDKLPHKVTGITQYVIIEIVLRHTEGLERLGGEPAPEWSGQLTSLQFARITGSDSDTCELAAKDACERGLLERKKQGRGYVYRALTDRWRDIPKYTPKCAPKKPPQVEEDIHSEVADTPRAHRVSVVPAETPLRLEAGSKPEPLPLPSAPKKLAFIGEAGSQPLTITRAEIYDDTLHLHWSTCHGAAPRAAPVDSHDTPRGHRVSESTFVDNKRLKGTLVLSDFERTYAEVLAICNELGIPYFKTAVPDHTARAIAAALSGKSTDQFRERVRLRMSNGLKGGYATLEKIAKEDCTLSPQEWEQFKHSKAYVPQSPKQQAMNDARRREYDRLVGKK